MQTATISAQKPLPASWRGIHFRGTAAGQWTEASLAGISTLDPPDLIQYKHGSVSGTTKTQPALSGSLRNIRSKAPPQEPRRDLEKLWSTALRLSVQIPSGAEISRKYRASSIIRSGAPGVAHQWRPGDHGDGVKASIS